MIKVSNLTKRFGSDTAVDDLTFSVERGQVLGFLGPNGAGKSTTMKMISGFLQPDIGTVEIDGIDIQQHPIQAKRKLGYLPEGIPLYSDMPVQSFLSFVAGVRGVRGADLVTRMAEVVSQVQIDNVLTQPIHTLSKGYKRRVGIAQALLHDPEVLILDEPTDGLDPNQKDQITAMIDRISADKAIILSTHILAEVETVCNRVIIINQGQIIADQTPERLVEVSRYHNAVRLQVIEENRENVENELRNIDEVADVRYIEKSNAFHLVSTSGHSLVDQVWRIAHSNGWNVRTLSEEKGELEDVFRQLTGGS